MDYKANFIGKKITLIGLGILGRGVGDAKFLAEEGAELIVTDLKNAKELESSVAEIKEFPNIQFVLGEHRLEDFRNRDFILKAAGVPLDSPFIAEARKNGIPIEMSTALFAALTPATIVGVTGTRGKSTVTQLINSILKEAGKNVLLGGNIRGIATLPLIRSAKEGDIAVLELDSWQLQGFGERKISPHISVFTNFMADHQNYYKGDMNSYFNDKAQIFFHQTANDILVIGKDLWEAQKKDIESHSPGKIVIADEKNIPRDWNILIPGEHNKKNIACAMEASRSLGISDAIIRASTEHFIGIEGRLQLIRELNGIKIYNDTNSTTPDATLAGLEALSKNKNIILIMGGADKQLNMAKLVQSWDFYCKRIILLPGTGTERLKEFGTGSVSVPMELATNLAESFAKAYNAAKAGDIILFSPAFASFGIFMNEYDRGDQFMRLVNTIQK
jgi:UDP-N-acetylmuramoylalanine--D-glutamate ligase